MPTHDELLTFWRDWDALSADQQRRFRLAVAKFRAGLRVRGIQGTDGIFELTWADDRRATFQHGEPQGGTEPHIIWRRIGTHRIFDAP